MALIDPEQEGQRLSEFYAGQLDGQLEKVAEQAYDLTDLAREALRAELTKRGLQARVGRNRSRATAAACIARRSTRGAITRRRPAD
jgi:hypothetical protein